MRTECRHYFRRSSATGESLEGCALGVAPDAPDRCPAHCQFFEKRQLSTTGFVYGSLAPKPDTAPEPERLSEEGAAVLDELESLMDEIGDDVVAEERQRRAAEERRAAKKRRWKFGR